MNPVLCDEAVALQQKGQLPEAETLYLEILAADPQNFTATHLLGVLRHQQGRNPEALELIGAALKLAPHAANAWSNYGLVFRALGRFEEALAQYDKALALKPDLADALNNRGIALLDLNRFEEALASYDKALVIAPNSATVHGNRGLVLQYLGRLDEARAAFHQSLTLDPGRANIYLDYADSTKLTADDPHLKAMEVLRGSPLSNTEQLQLDFALAKAYADLKDPTRSFTHLLSGNALKRAQITYDEAGVLGFFDRVQTLFSPALLREKESLGGDPSAAPIFIMGMPRSGSTLVEQILASHPDVHGTGELPAFARISNAVGGGGVYPEFVSGLDGAALKAIGKDYLAELRKSAPTSPRITDKMLSNYFYAGLIHLALPNAPIIHTVRDPLDNCLSCFSKLFIEELNQTYDLGELGRYYRRYEILMAHWRRVLPQGRILDVRYEDLVADLEGQARRIIAHCGLAWDARCLSFHNTDRPVRTASFLQVRQPIYKNAVGRAQAYDAFLGPLKIALAGENGASR